MLGGYAGRILFVNLRDGSIEEERLPEGVYRSFIGGVGLGAKILYEHMETKVDPLGSKSLLGFITGPLTGAPIPAAAITAAVAKSPLSGTWANSFSGGYFGSELKAAGYDGVFFSDISAKPVYLLLLDGKVELREATRLWGKTTSEAEEILRQELGDKAVRVACIGPAGESLSLLAAVIHGKGRAFGRSGLGAVMGAKRLKAIAVRGKNKLEVADTQRLKVLRENFVKGSKKNKYLLTLMAYGTCGIFSPLVIRGSTPIKNWTLSGEAAMPTHSRLHGASVTKYQVKKYPCNQCSVGCGGIVTVEGGQFSVSEGHKPEYETLSSFGALCLNDNVEAVIKANDICNRYGIDTISAGATIAFAIECYENGVIGKQETEGVELTWGDPVAIIIMLEKMAKREGFGAVFADGVKKAAERIGKGSEKWAVHIHGQEPGAANPRLYPACGTFYIADPTPGNHMIASTPSDFESSVSSEPRPELGLPQVDLYDCQNPNKGILYAIASSYHQLLNSSGACWFAAKSGLLPLAECISAVTGWEFTMAEALTVGRRIQTLRQLFNTREGLSPRDFCLPSRMKDPLTTGPLAGQTFDFDTLRRSYYEAMGWDIDTGKPSKQSLQELGLM